MEKASKFIQRYHFLNYNKKFEKHGGFNNFKIVDPVIGYYMVITGENIIS